MCVCWGAAIILNSALQEGLPGQGTPVEEGEGASLQGFGGGHSRQRTAHVKILWRPGPGGLKGLCDLCDHTGLQAQKLPYLV